MKTRALCWLTVVAADERSLQEIRVERSSSLTKFSLPRSLGLALRPTGATKSLGCVCSDENRPQLNLGVRWTNWLAHDDGNRRDTRPGHR